MAEQADWNSGREQQPVEKEVLNQERLEILEQLEEWLETPLLVLGLAWLVLLVVELVWGLNPLLEGIVTVIWIVFIVDFVIRFALAPQKIAFFKGNWLTAISLVVPALRLFRVVYVVRVLRLASAARGLRLFRIVSSLNRGMRSLRASMGRRGFGYVLALTALVTLVGAAGMQAFENQGPMGNGLDNYSEALWWTAMIMTTIGSEYWPVTGAGRILAFLLSVYGLAVFGYLTATLATYFVGREAESQESEIAGEQTLRDLRAEIRALRADLERLTLPAASREEREQSHGPEG